VSSQTLTTAPTSLRHHQTFQIARAAYRAGLKPPSRRARHDTILSSHLPLYRSAVAHDASQSSQTNHPDHDRAGASTPNRIVARKRADSAPVLSAHKQRVSRPASRPDPTSA